MIKALAVLALSIAGFAFLASREMRSAGDTAFAEISREIVKEKTTGGEQWEYRSGVDKMDDSARKFAAVASSNFFELSFPYHRPQRAMLTLRNMGKQGMSVALGVERGQFLWRKPVVVRIDGGDPVTLSTSEAANGRTDVIFLDDHKLFTKLIRGKSSLLIRAEFYQETSPVFEFDVSGLDESKLK
jgi:hypothetical protein